MIISTYGDLIYSITNHETEGEVLWCFHVAGPRHNLLLFHHGAIIMIRQAYWLLRGKMSLEKKGDE
jgi:hypothetical protein